MDESGNHFYLNNGDGTFSALLKEPFLTTLGVGNIGLWADYNNDGNQDKTLNSLRNQLGVILQTPRIFSGTLVENIRYADQETSLDNITQVLTSIGAPEMIDRLDEEVGEEGRNLSTGEKQLISFARVILKDPKILIMDEATLKKLWATVCR